MSYAYVFGPNEDDNDYSTMGLVGALTPTENTFRKTENGESTITLKHPLDEFGRYSALQKGNILVVKTPVRTVPEIQNGSCVTTVWTYKVKPLNQLTSTAQRTLYKKATGSNKKQVMNAGDTVTVVQKPEQEDSRWKVRSKYGTGWIIPDGFVLVTTHNIPDNSSAIEEIQSPWVIVAQYFRIYEEEKTLKEITVAARHIRYDLLKTLTRYSSETAVTLQTALDGILNNCYTTHPFKAYTNVPNEQAGLFYKFMNPIEAFVNPEEGICKRFNVSLVADNYDLYFLHDPGKNRGVRIQYRKNMLGVNFKMSDDEVATRIVPIGETKDGKPLMLSDTLAEQYVDSPNINAYPIVHAYKLECTDCKVGDKDENGGTITVSSARARMRQQALDLLATGCDQPKITMSVEFLNLGDTEEYSQFRNLENCFLSDYIVVQHGGLGIDVTAKITVMVWDCIRDRMKSVTIGSVGKTLANSGITTWQIPSGFSGSKIAGETIGSGALMSDIIATRHVQADSINTSALQAESVTADKLDAVTVNAHIIEALVGKIDTIISEQITTDALYSALAEIVKLRASEIVSGTVSTDTLYAELARIIELRVKQITAESISTDELYSELARIMVLRTNEITSETIQTDELYAELARITELRVRQITAETVDTDTLYAELARIIELRVGQIDADSIATDTLYATLANIIYLRVQEAVVGTVTTDTLRAALADITNAEIDVANINYANIKDIVTNSAIFTTGLGNTLYISRLSVTEANMVSLSVGELMVKGTDNQFYRLGVDGTGEVITTKVEIEGENIALETISGSRLIENTITAREIHVEDLFADSAMFRIVKAANIDVAELFADSATFGKITTDHLSSDFGEMLNLESNAGINLRVQRIYEDVDELVGHRLEIVSTSDILSEAIQNTTLSAKVWHGSQDVTSSFIAQRFNWTRVSSDSTADNLWNAAHAGLKSITLSVLDVQYSATYSCELTDL